MDNSDKGDIDMLITILLSLMMMAGLFLMLWSGVGFIQDKKFFSSAPKEAIEVTPDYVPERFKGQHAVGYVMAALSLVLMGGAVILGAWDGIKNEYGFWLFFVRFLVMLLLLKAFDVIFFDWVLLCNQGFGFFTRYYPQVGSVYNRSLFGYNKKTHITHVICFFPACALLAWICTLL